MAMLVAQLTLFLNLHEILKPEGRKLPSHLGMGHIWRNSYEKRLFPFIIFII